MPLPRVKISISDAYFSAAETMADFFNRIDPKLTVEFIILDLAGIDQALLISVVDVHSDN